jgi:parallel beta-helix repeat protein
MFLEHSCNNAIYNNNLTNNGFGIWLANLSNYNNITDNLVVSKAEKTDPARYWDGITIYSSNHNRMINNTIGKLWDVGIGFYYGCNNTVQGNAITDIYGRNEPYDEVQQLGYGISLYNESNCNVVTNNNVSNAYPWGIELWTDCDSNSIQYNTVTDSLGSESSSLKLRTNCSENSIMFNSLANNSLGIHLENCSGNSIYRNNFINNTVHVSSSYSANLWNGSYPSGGNYWSGYNTSDACKGPSQNEPGWDGVNDTKYQIDQNNTDYQPTINSWPLYQLKVEAWAIGDGRIETAGIWINGTEPHQNSTAYYLLKPATWNVTAEAAFTRQDPYDETKFYDYTFDHWEDYSTQNPRTLTLSMDKNLIAYYKFRVWYISKAPPK